MFLFFFGSLGSVQRKASLEPSEMWQVPGLKIAACKLEQPGCKHDAAMIKQPLIADFWYYLYILQI